MDIFFDLETTGKYDFEATPDAPIQPYITEFGAVLMNNGQEIDRISSLIKPCGWFLPSVAAEISGLTMDDLNNSGVDILPVLNKFNEWCLNVGVDGWIIGHNLAFDMAVFNTACLRFKLTNITYNIKNQLCTMEKSKGILKIKSAKHGFKYPSLIELYEYLFHEKPAVSHRAVNDVETLIKCFYELENRGLLI